jgi:phosphohistidine swiveling domain-containing protein
MDLMESAEQSALQEILKATPSQLEEMGGKAATLALLLQRSFPVPPGISVFKAELNAKDEKDLAQWVESHHLFPVAVRSSARGEDGNEVSYAGQFKTFLNVKDIDGLLTAIRQCFEAVNQKSSQAYAEHFQRPEIPMRVLVQKMIQPQFSGVFFTRDPRGQTQGWMFEAVRGLGEKLVSGAVTPYRYLEEANSHEATPTEGLTPAQAAMVADWGKKVQVALGYSIDMEWAIDSQDQFWILQVRPITTGGSDMSSEQILKEELHRVQSSYSSDTIWDGHSFAELGGVPTPMTFSIWREAFLPGRAFDLALKSLGYEGVSPASNESLLDSIFGRSFLNLKKMEPVYFGASPYVIEAEPRPHLRFEWSKLNAQTLAKAPMGIWQMAKVAWTIQTHRREIAKKAEDLFLVQHKSEAVYRQTKLRAPELQYEHFLKIVSEFTKTQLQGTFLITLLIESTTQSIMSLLSKDLGEKQAAIEFQNILSKHLSTVASEMSKANSLSHTSHENWAEFVSLYGHRGLEELELARPRWIEFAPPKLKPLERSSSITRVDDSKVLDNILSRISAIRRPILSQEISELQALLQKREVIKMESMKTYADLRWSLLAVGQNLGLNEDIFFLSLNELCKIHLRLTAFQVADWKILANKRRQSAKVFKTVELPMSFSARGLEGLFENSTRSAEMNSSATLRGVSLSPGISSGRVHIVLDPQNESPESWPENTVLVAEATDPGWTPLFERAKAIVVARGGILSHCAIVAREMGLPAVGEIQHATTIFKEGEDVRVDGIHGTVTRTS